MLNVDEHKHHFHRTTTIRELPNPQCAKNPLRESAWMCCFCDKREWNCWSWTPSLSDARYMHPALNSSAPTK